MVRLSFLLVGLLIGVLAASAFFLAGRPVESPAKSSVSPRAVQASLAALRPSDLAVQTCISVEQSERAPAQCAIVAAGGKRFLFGAPDGVGFYLDTLPDGVFLMGVRGRQVAGLSGLRYETWLMGREASLAITGPQPIDDIAEHLNQAHEVSDASTYVAVHPQLFFAGAPITSNRLHTNEILTVFDSGDVTVDAFVTIDPNGAEQAAYRLDYSGLSVGVVGCHGGIPSALFRQPLDLLVSPAVDPASALVRRRQLKQEGQRALLRSAERTTGDCRTKDSLLSSARLMGVSAVLILAGPASEPTDPVDNVKIVYPSMQPILLNADQDSMLYR